MTIEVHFSDHPIDVIIEECLIDVQVHVGTVDVILGDEGPMGQVGPTGAAGGTVVTRLAAQNLSGHRVVKTVDGGLADYASNSSVGDADVVLGITGGASAVGEEVDIYVLEEMEEPSWAWSVGPIFLGQNGGLTQAVPTALGGAAFIRQVATALSPTRILIQLRPPIAIS
jgi:hypothetical protein